MTSTNEMGATVLFDGGVPRTITFKAREAISGGQFGSLKELEVDIKEVKWYQARYIACLAEETGMSERKIRSLFRKKTDTFFDAQQAVEWGIADEII